jgi:hypothetical protein
VFIITQGGGAVRTPPLDYIGVAFSDTPLSPISEFIFNQKIIKPHKNHKYP